MEPTKIVEPTKFEAWIRDNFGAVNGQGDEYTMLCPNPKHNDTQASFGFNVRKGVFNCFGCGWSGSLFEFVARYLGGYQAGQMMSELKKKGFLSENGLKNSISSMIFMPDTLPPATGRNDYLYVRGFSDETIKVWNLRTNLALRAVIIPVYDEANVLVGYRGRRLLDLDSRYFSSLGLPSNRILFGLNHDDGKTAIILTEGEFDCMWLWQHGYNACSLLGGNNVAWEQMHLINKLERDVYTVFDADEAGNRYRNAAKHKLKNLQYQFVPCKHDVQEMTKYEIRRMFCHHRLNTKLKRSD